MAQFRYTARDGQGNLTQGTLEAENDRGAADDLRKQGLWVTELHSSERRREGGAAPVDRSFVRRLRSPVPVRDLAIFYRQLHTMLNAGMGLFQSLEMLAHPTQTHNTPLRRVVETLSQEALRGTRLSETMARFPWLFDRLQVRMVEAGEAGGVLVGVLGRLADYLDREHEVRQMIKQKTLYPKLVLGLLVLVFPINVPLTLQGYLGSLGQLLLFILMLSIPAWFAARVMLTTQSGRNAWDQVKLAIPVIGPLVRKMAVARFARALAALYGAGVSLSAGTAMAGEASGNHLLELQAQRISLALERGVSIEQALDATRFFPRMFTGMVATGESTGNLDNMLDKAADFYEQEGAHAVTQLVVILGVVLLIGVAILVLFKLISFYTGMIGGIMTGAVGE
jgi:type IV pilus assembly protein PilC